MLAGTAEQWSTILTNVGGELTLGLTAYFEFYNGERAHQSLGERTPDRVYASRQGGGAMIVDKFGKDRKPGTMATSGQRRPAACEGRCRT